MRSKVHSSSRPEPGLSTKRERLPKKTMNRPFSTWATRLISCVKFSLSRPMNTSHNRPSSYRRASIPRTLPTTALSPRKQMNTNGGSSASGGLRALVVELVEVNAGLREVIAAKDHQIASLERRIEELERGLGADSSTSSRPPSSDSPYRKPIRRSSRKSSGRRPGKQPGDPGSTMPLVDDPDEVICCDPGCCGGCGADLSGAPVVAVVRRQVVEVLPPPPHG